MICNCIDFFGKVLEHHEKQNHNETGIPKTRQQGIDRLRKEGVYRM